MPSAPPETTPYPAPTAVAARRSARRQPAPEAARDPTRASNRWSPPGNRPATHRRTGGLESWRNAAGNVGALASTLKNEGAREEPVGGPIEGLSEHSQPSCGARYRP